MTEITSVVAKVECKCWIKSHSCRFASSSVVAKVECKSYIIVFP